MGNIGWMQIAIVVVLVVLLFGRGKIADLMGDVAAGIKNFREGLKDDDSEADNGDAPKLEATTGDASMADSVDETVKN